jgi:hypothetical protein
MPVTKSEGVSPVPTGRPTVAAATVAPAPAPGMSSPELSGTTFKQLDDPQACPFNVITPEGIYVHFDAEGYCTTDSQEVIDYLLAEFPHKCALVTYARENVLVEHVGA